MKISDRFEGCILGGAIGDAFGSVFENQPIPTKNTAVHYPFGKPRLPTQPPWRISDDTQLTLATCEAIIEGGTLSAELVAQKFVQYYRARKLTGLGASTLKAMEALSMGAHWSQAGRRGEYAACNGAAMRIAPLAFVQSTLNRQLIEQVSKITHSNDEAYAGALSVIISLQAILTAEWDDQISVFDSLIGQLPDTRVRDRFLAINELPAPITIKSLAQQFGCSGYIVESVPLAIFAASQVKAIGFSQMLEQLVACGGDTDTNCSIAGQLAGAWVGAEGIQSDLLKKLQALNEYRWIKRTIDLFISKMKWI